MGTTKRRKTALKRDFGCPLTRNNSPWCFSLCEPNEQGVGECGRHALHAMMGRTQKAILREKLREAAEQDRARLGAEA